MNLDSFKVMLIQRNIIPEFYKTSYLSFEDVYNLSLTCKSVRFQIENFCKNICRNFEDFETSNKIKKYKTWFNSLTFWDCKFPKTIIRNLIKNNNQNKLTTFIPINSTEEYEITLIGEKHIKIYPRIEFLISEIHVKRCINEKYCSLHGTFRKKDRKKLVIGCRLNDIERTYSCLFICKEKRKKNIRD